MERLLKLAAQAIPYGCTILLVLCVALGFFYFWRLAPSLKTIVFFVTGSLVMDLVSKAHLFVGSGSNLYLFPLLSLMEFYFISTYYLKEVQTEKSIKDRLKAIQVVGVVILVAIILVTFFTYDQDRIVAISGTIKTVVHLILVLLILHLMINQISREKTKIVTLGILIYYAGSSIIFLLFQKLVSTEWANSYLIWFINAGLLFILYSTCLIELVRWKRNS